MPLVLLTDFGSADYRVSQIKGIIYKNNPAVRLVEATQDVPAFDIPTGAFVLYIAAKEFPQNTVFVGIVSPYSQKPEVRYLVLTTNKDQVFVFPDNGLLTYVIRDMGAKTVYQIANQELFDQPIKDLAAERIQGKIGALIASGYRPQDVGTPLANPRTLDLQEPAITDAKLLGTVVYIDNFGNGVTNISGKTANEFGLKPGDSIRVSDGQRKISAKFGTVYSDVDRGKEIVFVNNNLDMLQLSVNLGSFAETHNIKAGAKIEIER
ncbi:MAG: SAM-dependent chlorinase/fluorinase [Chloroflexi bacterium]|nr:SAM-dependent chlorinase/fluorinase [Chloroflexota bacterium]